MPKENTHIYLAQEILEKIKDLAIKKIIQDNSYFYQLGSFTPDVFSYGKTENIIKISKNIHGLNNDKTNKIIFEMLDKVGNLDKDNGLKKTNLAFIFGFLTHLATDITFHPFVYFFTGNTEKFEGALYRHFAFETGLDRFFQENFIIPKPRNEELKNLIFLDILEKKYQISKKELLENYQRQYKFSKLFRIKSIFFVLKILNKIKLFDQVDKLGLFYANNLYPKKYFEKKFKYQDPVDGEKKITEIENLTKQAENLSVDYIETAYNYYLNKINKKEAEKIIRGENLSSGKIDLTSDKMSFFDEIEA